MGLGVPSVECHRGVTGVLDQVQVGSPPQLLLYHQSGVTEGCGVWGVACGAWGVGCGVPSVECHRGATGVLGQVQVGSPPQLLLYHQSGVTEGCGVRGVACGVWGVACGVWGT